MTPFFDRPILEAAIDLAIEHPERISDLILANGMNPEDVGMIDQFVEILSQLREADISKQTIDRDLLASRLAERSKHHTSRDSWVDVLQGFRGLRPPDSFPLLTQRLSELRFRRRLAEIGDQAQNSRKNSELIERFELAKADFERGGPGRDLFIEIDVLKAIRDGIPPIQFDIERFLIAGTLTYISGPPKSSKTWLALAWAICLVMGRSFCGLKSTGEHRVLFVEAEYPRQIIIRFEQLCLALQVNPETALQRIKFVRPRQRLRLEEPSQAARLLQEAQDFGATWVVIDSLRRVHTLEESSSRDMANLADGALLPLRGNEERGVLVIDHDAKAWQMGNRPKSQQLRGSGDKLAAADVLLHVEKHEVKDEPRRYELTVAASRVAEEDGESLWLTISPTDNGGIGIEEGEPVPELQKNRRGRGPTNLEQAINIIKAEKRAGTRA